MGYDDSFAHLPEAQWLARHAAGARVALRANSSLAQIAAARAGFRKVLLPRWFAEDAGGLVAVPPPAPPPAREAWLLVHRDLKVVPRVRAVIDAVVAAYEAEQERLGPAPSRGSWGQLRGAPASRRERTAPQSRLLVSAGPGERGA